MKSGKVAVAMAAAVVVAGITYAFFRETGAVADAGAESAASSAASASVVHVDDLADHPDNYQGEILLRAVVAKINKSQGLLLVIDFREFEECGQIGCAKHYLPVKVEGDLPKPKTVIELTGQVARTDKGLVFEAKRLETK